MSGVILQKMGGWSEAFNVAFKHYFLFCLKMQDDYLWRYLLGRQVLNGRADKQQQYLRRWPSSATPANGKDNGTNWWDFCSQIK